MTRTDRLILLGIGTVVVWAVWSRQSMQGGPLAILLPQWAPQPTDPTTGQPITTEVPWTQTWGVGLPGYIPPSLREQVGGGGFI